MIDIFTIVGLLGVLVFAAHFFDWLFSYIKIPDALLLMVVGLVLGPVLGVLTPSYFGSAGNLAVTIVLVVLLFQSGLGLRFGTILSAWRMTAGLSVVSFVATAMMVALVLWSLFALTPLVALAVGFIVGGTSSAVVISLLEQLSLQKTTRATLLLESVVSDVLAIVVTFALLEAQAVGSLNVPGVLLTVIVSFAGAAVFGGLVGLLWARLLRTVRQMQNSIFLTPAFVFVLFGAASQLGLNGPIAVLAFGILLGNVRPLNRFLVERHPFIRHVLSASPLRKKEKLFIAEVVFLLQTFFFIFVGMSLNVSRVGPLVIGLALVVLMVLVRLLVIRLVVPRTVLRHDAILMATMVPKGLAAAALAALPLQRGIAEGALIQDVTYAVILFSVITTSLLIFATRKTTLRGTYGRILSGFTS